MRVDRYQYFISGEDGEDKFILTLDEDEAGALMQQLVSDFPNKFEYLIDTSKGYDCK